MENDDKPFNLETIKLVAGALGLEFKKLIRTEQRTSYNLNMNLYLIDKPILLDKLTYSKNCNDFSYDDAITEPVIIELISSFFVFLESHIEQQCLYPLEMSPKQHGIIADFIKTLKQYNLNIFGKEYELVKDTEEGQNYLFNCAKIWIGEKLTKDIDINERKHKMDDPDQKN